MAYGHMLMVEVPHVFSEAPYFRSSILTLSQKLILGENKKCY